MKELLFNERRSSTRYTQAGQISRLVGSFSLVVCYFQEGTLIIEDTAYTLQEGDVTVVPSGKTRHLAAGDSKFSVLAVQSHQADKSCGLCALLESCVSLKG